MAETVQVGAFPHIMLGLNQTVLFALFSGDYCSKIYCTQDLGQKIME